MEYKGASGSIDKRKVGLIAHHNAAALAQQLASIGEGEVGVAAFVPQYPLRHTSNPVEIE